MKKLICVILLCYPLIASAQFQGGVGSGASFGYFNGALNAEPLAMFSGSIGDGHDFAYGVALTMQPGCDVNITMSDGPISAGLYAAEETITSSGKVLLGDVIFQAGSEVLLLPTFEVDAGHAFTINILGCSLANATQDQSHRARK